MKNAYKIVFEFELKPEEVKDAYHEMEMLRKLNVVLHDTLGKIRSNINAITSSDVLRMDRLND